MRIGILALLHESNTFLSQPTTIEHFRQNTLVTGDEVRARFADAPHEVGGFFAGLDEAGCEAVPLLAARALPYGTIAADSFQNVLDLAWRELDKQLAQPGSLDGILVAPHGATVAESERDADGAWLEQLRRRVGPKMPIIGTLDAHANLSPRMVAACDALVAYRSNPHLDQRARGEEAARLMVRTVRGEIRPTMAASFPPLAINIERQLTSELHCQRLYQLADRQLAEPRVLSNSILLGFPYADVSEMGSSLIVVTDDDRELAERLAGELARWLWDNRHDFVGRLISIDDAIDEALAEPGPVCLLDMGDNVGGGSPADSTFIAHALHRRAVPRSLVCLFDPESVSQAVEAGIGAQVELQIGGKSDRLHGEPLAATFTVVSLHDGRWTEHEARHGGFTNCDQGPTAVVRSASGLTAVLTSRRMPPFSLGQITSCGLDPAAFQILVAKGVIAPVAAYAPVCKRLIRVNSPGVTTADMVTLEYRYRRRPMFPFERDTKW